MSEKLKLSGRFQIHITNAGVRIYDYGKYDYHKVKDEYVLFNREESQRAYDLVKELNEKHLKELEFKQLEEERRKR